MVVRGSGVFHLSTYYYLGFKYEPPLLTLPGSGKGVMMMMMINLNGTHHKLLLVLQSKSTNHLEMLYAM